MKKRLLALICACLCLTGCERTVSATNLTANISSKPVKYDIDVKSVAQTDVADFGVRLFKENYVEGENILISPLSVLSALAMTANGADEETLLQMEETFGMSVQSLNEYFVSYELPSTSVSKLEMANSIWLRQDTEDFEVSGEFLSTVKSHYGADVFECAFDSTTVKDVNSWVSENTNKMIQHMIDDISDDAIMYLINALAFDSEWEEKYEKDDVKTRTFTNANGSSSSVKMMYSEEYDYFELDNACGFMKPYKDGKYAFVGILPDEDITLSEFVTSLTGEDLITAFAERSTKEVDVGIPKFKSEYSIELSGVLTDMGMPLAFDEVNANFRGLGTYPPNKVVYISKVLHKTFVELDEHGTKASAATVVEMVEGNGAAFSIIERSVILNRPFMYMIIDYETELPVFIGTVSYL